MTREPEKVLATNRRLTATKMALIVITCSVVALLGKWLVFSNQASETFNIVIMGGSTSEGEPYAPRIDFGELASHFLHGEIDGRPIQINNLASGGSSSKLVRELARKVPGNTDVVFMYSGHNEFLQYDKKHDLSSTPENPFEELTSVAHRKQVIEGYGRHIEKAVVYLKERGIPVILSTVASNIADWDPNLSVIENQDNESRVMNLLESANELRHQRDFKKAERALKEIIELEARFALAYKRLGDIYKGNEQYGLAKKYYLEAADRDENPYRAVSQQNEILRNIASKHRLPLVDAERLFETDSSNQLVGFNLMFDNCHPNFRGYVLLGREFAQQLSLMFSGKAKDLPEDFDSIKKIFHLDAAYEYEVYLSRADFCLRAATLTATPSFRLERAIHYLDVASRLHVDAHLHTSYALVYSLMDDSGMAEGHWRKAIAIDASATGKRWVHPRVVQVMSRSAELREVAARLDHLFNP